MALWSNLAGTVLGYFRMGLTGPRLKNNAGVLAVRNAGDTADASVSMLNGTVAGTLGVTGRITGSAGMDLAGSPSGYTDELRFTSTTPTGIAGVSTLYTGAATMFFDHRGVGNTGNWSWRNTVDGGFQAMALSAAGGLTIPGTLSLTGAAIFGSTIRLKGYTVATLPAGTQGDKAFVTDASAGSPTYLATVAGGGAVVKEVFYDGTNWVCT